MFKTKEAEKAHVLAFFKGDGAYGLAEIEIDRALLEKHGKIVDQTEPDVFGVFLNNLTKKARELFKI